jgi:hypothetical protein
MNRIPMAVLAALAIACLPGCSSTPPKVSCERHLSPINAAPAAAGAGPVVPGGVSGIGTRSSSTKAPAHGR